MLMIQEVVHLTCRKIHCKVYVIIYLLVLFGMPFTENYKPPSIAKDGPPDFFLAAGQPCNVGTNAVVNELNNTFKNDQINHKYDLSRIISILLFIEMVSFN